MKKLLLHWSLSSNCPAHCDRSTLQVIRTMACEYALCSLFVPGDRQIILGTKVCGHTESFRHSVQGLQSVSTTVLYKLLMCRWFSGFERVDVFLSEFCNLMATIWKREYCSLQSCRLSCSQDCVLFLLEWEAADLWAGFRKPSGNCRCPWWSCVVNLPGPRSGKPHCTQLVCLSVFHTQLILSINWFFFLKIEVRRLIWFVFYLCVFPLEGDYLRKCR